MSTVVDELIVALKLDPKDFQKGQKEAATAFSKTKAEAVSTGKTIEDSGKKSAEAINHLAHEAMALFAIFAGARGIKEFVADLTASDSALGRLAYNLKLSPQSLSAFEMAVERNGGTADDAAASFQALSTAIAEFRTGGSTAIQEPLSKLQNTARSLAGSAAATFDLSKPVDQTWLDIATNLAIVAKADPSIAANFGRQLGFGGGSTNFLMQGRSKVLADLAESNRLGVVKPGDVKAAQDLQASWIAVQQAAESLGREIKTNLSPVIIDIIKQVKDWLEANKDWLGTKIVDSIKEFRDALPDIRDDIVAIVKGANDAATAFGGWGNAIKLLLGLWVGANFLKILANIGLLRVALFGAGAGGGGAGLGRAGLLGMLGAGLIYNKPTTDGIENTPALTDAADQRGWVERAWGAVKSTYQKYAPTALGGNKSPGSWWTPERMKYAADYLMQNAGLSQAGAAGLVARWSGVEAPGGPTSSNNIGGGHWGVAQWGLSRGGLAMKGASFEDQLKHAVAELNGSEAGPAAALRRAKTPWEGAVGASMFERAGGYNQSTGMDSFTRATPSQKVFDALYGQNAPSPSAGGTSANSLPIWARPNSINRNSPMSIGPTPPWISDWQTKLKQIQSGPYGALSSQLGASRAGAINNQSSSNQTSNETNVGAIHVHTSATDGPGIAADIKTAISRDGFTTQANYGPR